MPKFTFIGEHTDLYGKPNGTKIVYEFHVEQLSDVLEHTDLFIKGCGYNPQGLLDYVLDEDIFIDGHEGMGTTLEDYQRTTDAKYNPDEILHSGFYYDTERNK